MAMARSLFFPESPSADSERRNQPRPRAPGCSPPGVPDSVKARRAPAQSRLSTVSTGRLDIDSD